MDTIYQDLGGAFLATMRNAVFVSSASLIAPTL
jgi:hypothetical protein